METSAVPSKERVNRAGQWFRELWADEHDLDDDMFGEEAAVLIAWRAQFAGPIALTMPGLRNWVGRYSSLGIQPVQRLKRLPKIVVKLSRHPNMKLARMQDIGGARAILANRAEVDAVLGRIESKWKVVNITDWRRQGRPDSGYRALHVMVAKRDSISGQDRVVEIQLRTAEQQRWAEVVAQTEDRHGFDLRDGDGPTDLVEYFRKASDLLAFGDGEIDALPPGFSVAFDELRERVRPFFR